MEVMQKVFIAFDLTVITKEPSELGMWNLEWGH